MAEREHPVIPHSEARNLRKMQANCIATLLRHGNGSHNLDLDRIAFHQGFDEAEFTAAFLEAETKARMQPVNGETWEGK